MFETRDPSYNSPALETYGSKLRGEYAEMIGVPVGEEEAAEYGRAEGGGRDGGPEPPPVDVREVQVTAAIAALRDDAELVARLRTADGARWWDVQRKLKAALLQSCPIRSVTSSRSTSLRARSMRSLARGCGESYHPTLPDGSRDKAWVRGKGVGE